jgi:hypothetical protein
MNIIEQDISNFDSKKQFIKQIFMYWNNGYNNLNDMSKICVKLIKRLNPEYKLIFLDNNNVHEYFPYYNYLRDNTSLEFNHTLFSDILRIYLISKFGGIWLDCSCLVSKHFTILEQIMETCDYYFYTHDDIKCFGHFMNNWFMASKSNNSELGNLFLYLVEYITKPRINKLAPTHQVNPIISFHELKTIYEDKNVFPYFLFQYILNIFTIHNKINISNILFTNTYIKNKTNNFFAHVGVHKYNRRHFDTFKILDSEENIMFDELQKITILEDWKKNFIINTLNPMHEK